MSTETETTQEDASSAQEEQEKESIVTSLDVRELSPSKVELHIEVGSDHVDRAFKAVYRQLSRSGRVPGFRRGRVPPAVLKRYFSEEAISDAAVSELAPNAVTEAVEQAGVVVIDVAPIEDVKIAEGDVLRFTATLEIRPRPRLGQYKELPLVRPHVQVTDEQIEQELAQAIESASVWAEPDRTTVRKGDRAFADVVVKVEGQDDMSDTDVPFHVGEGRIQPPIDEGMIGAEVGSTLDIETKYPDDFDDEDLAGQPAVATVTINRIEEHHEPELGDEFAKENYGFDTLDELRADIRQRLETAANERVENELKQQALAQAVENTEIDIPQRLAAEQAELRRQQITTDAGQYGMRYEDVLQATEASHEEMTERLQQSSEQTLKGYFVIEAIAEAEQIEVSDEEVDAEIERVARAQDRPPDAVREELGSEDNVDALRLRLREEKVLSLLLESATVEDAPRTDESPEDESADDQDETAQEETAAAASDQQDQDDPEDSGAEPTDDDAHTDQGDVTQ